MTSLCNHLDGVSEESGALSSPRAARNIDPTARQLQANTASRPSVRGGATDPAAPRRSPRAARNIDPTARQLQADGLVVA
eukprot:1195703-Prorocentrum_minimum.AAC.1